MNPHNLVCAVAVVLVPSCTFQSDEGSELREVPLAKLANWQMFLDVRQNPTDGPAGMHLLAVVSRNDARSDRSCITIPGLEAALGPAVIAAFPGGWGYRTPSDERMSCLEPSVTIAVDEIQGLDRNNPTLVLRDASQSISTQMGNLLITRTVELVAPPTQGYRFGDLIRFRWQPASDLEQGHRRVELEGPQGWVTVDETRVSREGDQLTFPMLESVQSQGLRTLRPTVELDYYNHSPGLTTFTDPRPTRTAYYKPVISFTVLP